MCKQFGATPEILAIGQWIGGGLMPRAEAFAQGDLDIALERALGHYKHDKD